MVVDAVQLVGLSMGAPVREDGLYRYTIIGTLALMTTVEGRLEYIEGLPLMAAREAGWDPEVRVDLPLPETAGGGSPSVADVGQQMLGGIAQALGAKTALWTGYTLTV